MLNGKVVVITGGAGLIGRSFTQAITSHGAKVVVADLNQSQMDKFAVELDSLKNDTEVLFEVVDITSKESLQALLEKTHSKYGRVDALVNNAYPRNPQYGRRFEAVEYSDFCENISMHVGGYFLAAQQFAAYFQQQGYGNIVNMSSIYGHMAPRFEVYTDTSMTMPVEYASIKAAIENLTRYMAQYLKGKNIRVNCISPGGILDKQPQNFLNAYNKLAAGKGMLDPVDIAGTLVYLLSDSSQFVNGQNITVDDGWSL